MHFVLWGSLQLLAAILLTMIWLFQCTSCFGVLFNFVMAFDEALTASFNALRALGFSSTIGSRWHPGRELVSMHFVLWGSLQRRCRCIGRDAPKVSMHFVLWGSLQPDLRIGEGPSPCFNALRALGFSSTKQPSRMTRLF